ncbi:hypothetical protein [Pseudomonas kitaguniensis]|uniref:hypothetical protein n=1 Tax=Pseudomonas kitaguniensis TaxID=2607908 RepID=UPI003CFF78F1
MASAFERRQAPPCVYNVDMRPAAGSAAPFSGANHPELQVWVKHLDAEGVDPLVALIALADALPPAAVTVLTEPVPLSTVSWTFDNAGTERAANGGGVCLMQGDWPRDCRAFKCKTWPAADFAAIGEKTGAL